MNGQFGMINMRMPIYNMGMPINNIGMPMNPMNMMINMGMPMNMPFIMGGSGNDDWLKGYQLGVEEINTAENDNDSLKQGPKINIFFHTTKGTKTIVVVNHGTTIEETLEKYLKRVGRPELVNKTEDKICFLYNAAQLKFGDKTPVEKFFSSNSSPKVVVNDINNLIGASN